MAEMSIGSVLAGYRIEGLAGEGGMGRVYRATQLALNRQVAVKVIVPELNLGQMCRIVRAEYLVDAKAITKVQGLPFTSAEIERAIVHSLAE